MPSQSQRLREHAARYHRVAHKSIVIQKYSSEVQESDTAAVRQYAAHVAAWIAYAPSGRRPKLAELRLLQQFMDRLGAGLLPSRLQEVLIDTQALLQSTRGHQASKARRQAESHLQQSFRKFRCCRHTDKAAVTESRRNIAKKEGSDVQYGAKRSLCEDAVPVPGDALAVADSDAQPWDVESFSQEATSLSAPPSNQHLRLFQKINEWGFLDESQRLERLKAAAAATRLSRNSLNQTELADVVQTAAAALSAPHRKASAKVCDAEGHSSHAALECYT